MGALWEARATVRQVQVVSCSVFCTHNIRDVWGVVGGEGNRATAGTCEVSARRETIVGARFSAVSLFM